ncbi:unnamed protein product [Rotaria sordida]|uniref:Uncharacterized protein n=1 Tax=Rotaria sordida TaxID=392033 RepID=A0A819QZR3_9BILA|nr:unnamed protein product [Rotaria sordida]
MPINSSCTDITCDDEIKELYECHCCLRLVCLNHLIEHVEIAKKTKQRLNSLCSELNTMVNIFKQIVEEKRLTIEREQNLIEQAKQFLNEPDISIEKLENIFEKVHQGITSNRSEMTVKVEPSLSEIQYCSCICKCDKENMNPNDVAEESEISKGDVLYLEDINYDFTDLETTKSSIQDEHVNDEEVEHEGKLYRKMFNKCPLTFDGAYGLTKANHSIEFCKHGTTRRMALYRHFMYKHKLKKVYVKRLLRAIATNQDPRKIKLFKGNENVIDHFYNVPCPFFSEQMNSSKYSRQNVTTIPCQLRLVPFNTFKRHLQRTHNISNSLAQKLHDDFKKNREKNYIASTSLISSTHSK